MTISPLFLARPNYPNEAKGKENSTSPKKGKKGKNDTAAIEKKAMPCGCEEKEFWFCYTKWWESMYNLMQGKL